MDFFDLVNISERFLEIADPTTPEKLVTLGKYLGLREGSCVLDFASGYAEALLLWAEHFGIDGVGVEIRPHACERAQRKVEERGLTDNLKLVCGDAKAHVYDPQGYDAVTCIGASFVWGGWRGTLRAMKPAVRSGGRIAIGEPYWLTSTVPVAYKEKYPEFHSEGELLRIAREEGYDLAYIVRASHDDWDTYVAGNWDGLLRWLADNPNHPERDAVAAHMRQTQDDYLDFQREYLGWAMYILVPGTAAT